MTNTPSTNQKTASPAQRAKACFEKAAKLHNQNKLEEALKHYTQAVAIFPPFPDAYNNMAVALRRLQKFEASLACYRKSIAIREDHAGTYSNMGNVLNDLDRVDESLKAHTHALRLEPDNLLYMYNKALVLRDAGETQKAINLFNRVLKKDPNYKDLKWDRALTYLMQGDLKEGFAEYDSRWSLDKSPPRTFKQPKWDGSALGNKTLFIHREQGFGDAIQFARLVPSVKKRFGGRVVLECQPELVNLFQGIEGVDDLVPAGSPLPEFDYWIPLMSLGQLLDVTEENIPGDVPFLPIPQTTRLKIRPAPKGGMNVGIVWAGSPTHQNDRRRTAGLTPFLELAGHPNVTLFSLQKGPRTKDLQTEGAFPLVIDAGREIKDFFDTAGLMLQLDLIITVDTSVAHLTGALGKPVWVMLPFTPDWRWMLNREDSPWYPTMRLFRQPKAGDWESAFKKMYDAFAEQLQK